MIRKQNLPCLPQQQHTLVVIAEVAPHLQQRRRGRAVRATTQSLRWVTFRVRSECNLYKDEEPFTFSDGMNTNVDASSWLWFCVALVVIVVVSSPEPELYVIGNECTIHSNKYHCTLEKIHTLSSEKGEKHSVNWRRRHSKTLSPQTPLLPPTCSKTMKSTTKASSPSISS